VSFFKKKNRKSEVVLAELFHSATQQLRSAAVLYLPASSPLAFLPLLRASTPCSSFAVAREAAAGAFPFVARPFKV
jgi:hypothetical protein